MQESCAALVDLCGALFAGPTARYGGGLAFGAPAPDAVAAPDLAAGLRLEGLLARFGDAYPGADPRAIASFWSQYYFATLLTPLTVLCLASDSPLRFDPDGIRVRFCPRRGTPLSLHLGAPAEARTGAALYEALLARHVAAVVDLLHRRCGLSARLLWENAGGYAASVLGEIGPHCPAATAAAGRLCREGAWTAVSAVFPRLIEAALAGRPPVRRLCCLRYTLPGVDRCAELCPLRPGACGAAAQPA